MVGRRQAKGEVSREDVGTEREEHPWLIHINISGWHGTACRSLHADIPGDAMTDSKGIFVGVGVGGACMHVQESGRQDFASTGLEPVLLNTKSPPPLRDRCS